MPPRQLRALVPLGLACAAAQPRGGCWGGDFTAELCCGGDGGNPTCWDGGEFTYEACCTQGEAEDEEGGSSDGDPNGHVVFNDQLAEIARSIRASLDAHMDFEARGSSVCRPDGSITGGTQLGEQLRVARDEVLVDAGEEPPEDTSGVDEAYARYVEILPFCPQAVLQGTLVKVARMLQHLRATCQEQSLFRACQANTPFMFDLLFYYVILKHGLVEAYVERLGGGNVTADYAFRGWPLEQLEDSVWTAFFELWRILWPQRDHCACVDGYDYYTTMHARFDASLRVGSGDFADRVLRRGSEAQRIIEAASYCDEWLGKDFQRLFSTYAKHTACLPGAIMENTVCATRWIVTGHIAGALNTAEMMAKLMSLAGTCLADTQWPFSRDDVLFNFARLALHWEGADVGCQALNRFGERLSRGACVERPAEDALRRLLWAPSPLRGGRPPRLSACSVGLRGACVVEGRVHLPSEAQSPGQEVPLESCSETGRKRHMAVASTPERLAHLWNDEEVERELVGFVLNLPEFSNVWHNMHWLVPAVARLYRDPGLAGRVPGSVVLLLLFEGYSFSEAALEPPKPAAPPSGDELDRRMKHFVVRHVPFLRLLTSTPPVLLSRVQRRCFGTLIWGHPEMRADRVLSHPLAVGPPDAAVFRHVLTETLGVELDFAAERYWPAAEGAPLRVLLVQRAEAHGRAILRLGGLVEAGLAPLPGVVWRVAEDLDRRPLLQQLAIFSSADVIIGAVGAALGWLVVMRPGAQVLEWLPSEVPPSLYRCSEAWNEDRLGMFGGLGRLAGVDHACLRSDAAAPEGPERSWAGTKTTVKDAYWRERNLDVDPDKFARWARAAVSRARRTREQRTDRVASPYGSHAPR